jgi:hypothetical protein
MDPLLLRVRVLTEPRVLRVDRALLDPLILRARRQRPASAPPRICPVCARLLRLRVPDLAVLAPHEARLRP